MSRFLRLRETHAGQLEARLLESTRDDAPSRAARQRTLRALALGGSVGVGGAAAGSSAALAAAPVKAVSAIVIAKWALVGAGVAVMSLGATEGLSRRSSPLSAKAPAVVAPSSVNSDRVRPSRAPEAQNVLTQDVAPEDAPAVSGEPMKKALVPKAPTLPKPDPVVLADAPSTTSPGGVSSLSDEVVLLDAARAAAAAHDPDRALAALDTYERDFPRGNLLPEAVVMRVQALAQRGDYQGATKVGRAFLEKNPHSPHADRVRSILAGTASMRASQDP